MKLNRRIRNRQKRAITCVWTIAESCQTALEKWWKKKLAENFNRRWKKIYSRTN